MAEAEKSFYEDQFSCSVCLDVLKNPATIPCGHSYCMSCINNFWVGLDHHGVYSCPQCRETFSPRPALRKNTLVAEVMEKLKNTSDQATSDHTYNTSTCVRLECDFCIGTKNPADKSCLQCLASYCELHLQPHYESPVFKKHRLVQPSAQVQKNICPHHGKLLDIYCRNDQQCICYLCMVESHKDHNTLSVESERIKNQDALEKTKIQCQQMINQKEEGLQEISKAVTSIKCFVQAVEADNERIFTELISSMKRRCSEVKELIKAQERAELSQAAELHRQLDHELADLRERLAEIEQILATKDHIDFIRKRNSVCAMPTFKDMSSITCHACDSPGNISISALKEHLEDVCQQEVAKISREVMNIHVVEPSELETRRDFLRYFCDLHMDPNTVHRDLCLSDGGRKVTNSPLSAKYPDHPERFDGFANVLCKEGLYGRCYWEAECSGKGWVMAVSFKNIRRKGNGDECRFGFNAKSWRLSPSQQGHYFSYNRNVIYIGRPVSLTIGVYLDHNAGTLSFYSVSDRMTLLHKVQTTFTEPVYAGFGVGGSSTVQILKKC